MTTTTTPRRGKPQAPKRKTAAAAARGNPRQPPFLDRGQDGRTGYAGYMPPDDGPIGEMFGPMISPEEALAAWVEQTLAKGPIERLRLVQKTTQGDAPVAEWDTAEELSDLDAGSIASLLYSRAVEDASGQTSLARYIALAYRPGRDVYCARHFFRVSPDDSDVAGFESEQGDTPAGHMAQAHRHSEASVRLLLNGVADILATMTRQVSRLSEQNETFANMQTEMLLAQQRLLDRGAERDLRVKEANLKIDQQARLKMKGEALLYYLGPHVLQRLGIPVPPGLMQHLAPGGMTPALPAAGGTAPPATVPGVQLTADEQARLRVVTARLMDLLVQLDDGPFAVIAGRLSPAGHADFAAARATARTLATEQRQATEVEAHVLVDRVMAHVPDLFCSVSDVEWPVLRSRLPDDIRSEADALRALIRQRFSESQNAPSQPTTTAT